MNEKKIVDMASRIFQIDVNHKSKINDFERWDSLGQLTLFMELENELKVKFTHEEIIGTNIMSDIVNLALDKLNKQ